MITSYPNPNELNVDVMMEDEEELKETNTLNKVDVFARLSSTN